jgi:signal transduction histidine kinase
MPLKGVFGLAYEKCQPVSTEEIELLSRFAELASLAINNAWLLEEATEARCQAEDQAKNLATINHINQLVSHSPDLTAALTLVTREIAQIFGVPYSRIALVNADRAGLTFVADYSLDPMAPSAVGMVLSMENNSISGQVVKTGRALVVQPSELALHIQTRDHPIFSILEIRNVQCLMITPLLVSGEVVGVIGLESTDPERIFSPADLRLAETIAGQIAGMIDKARLLKEAQEQRRIAESLHQVAAVLNASLDIETVLNSFLQQLGQVVLFDSAAILLHQGDALVVVSVSGLLDPENVISQTLPLSGGSPAVRVFRERAPLIIDNVQQEPGWIDVPGTQHIRGWMGIPLLIGERVLGVLEVNKLMVGGYGPAEAQVVQTFANQAATALENARLYRYVTDRTKELSQALEELKSAQHQLVDAEKMASLGGLVAGIAHEINTPIGIGVTAASTLEDETHQFLASYQNGALKRSELDAYLNTAQESSRLILNNLQRAAELVQSFKQVAVDQTNLERRKFGVKTYINDVLRSLAPQLKRSAHRLSVTGADDLIIDSYPGALSQVVTNLVMNSVLHAYPDDKGGQLIFEVRSEGKQVIIEYRDDGCGIAPETLKKIYEPFFTTARHRGGTGLGLHIVYNLVIQKLGGQINCESVVGQGTKFTLTLPMHL